MIRAAFVKPEFIKVVNVQPLLGRNFIDEEYKPGSPAIAILSYGLWRQRYRSDPSEVGNTLDLNGRKYIVIGVMPKEFTHPKDTEIWLPDQTE